MKTYGSINLRRIGKILLRIAIGLLAAVAVYTLIDIVTAFIKYDICELYVYEKYKKNGYDYPSIRLQDSERMAETSEIHLTREEMLEDIDYYFELILISIRKPCRNRRKSYDICGFAARDAKGFQ